MDQNPTTPREALRKKRLRLVGRCNHINDQFPVIDGLIDMQTALEEHHVTLSYDVRLTSLAALVTQLREHGIDLVDDRRTRLRIAWQSYLDRNARANLTMPDSPCCSNPTSVYASRRKR